MAVIWRKQIVLIFHAIKYQIILYFIKIRAKNAPFTEILQQSFFKNRDKGPLGDQLANLKHRIDKIRALMGLKWENPYFLGEKCIKIC